MRDAVAPIAYICVPVPTCLCDRFFYCPTMIGFAHHKGAAYLSIPGRSAVVRACESASADLAQYYNITQDRRFAMLQTKTHHI